VAIAVLAIPAVSVAAVTWPSGQLLPSFSPPEPTQDLITLRESTSFGRATPPARSPSASRIRSGRHRREGGRRHRRACVLVTHWIEAVPNRDRRTKRDLHALNEDGMLVCNPRDREAAHRAEVEGIATHRRDAVSCRKCQERLHRAHRKR